MIFDGLVLKFVVKWQGASVPPDLVSRGINLLRRQHNAARQSYTRYFINHCDMQAELEAKKPRRGKANGFLLGPEGSD